ncbi:MAG: glycoside hydrolase family 3 N-terminal domain-containing protein [Bacteroidales bacterium]|nr:glycoside hydrolase family 3 N-terminal domain-containing protein [Bacteroidales bacterium]
MKKLILLAGGFLLTATLFAQFVQEKQPQLGKNKIEEIIAAMSLQDKVYLVMGLGDIYSKEFPPEPFDHIIEGSAGRTWDISRLGIPATVLADGPAGLRIEPSPKGASQPRYCTAFPTSTPMASSWNTALIEEVGKAMGNEVLEYGCDVLLAPGMNIQRNPLCGRNFEYYSEDPFLSGKIAAQMIKGVQSNGVGTSIKHFVANNQESNRLKVNEVISQRALREIYLRGFEIAVKEASPWTVMSSYNRVNGYHTSESYDLLTTILRKEWGFKGIVISDWNAGTDATNQMNAGNDLIMPGGRQRSELMDAVKNKRLNEKTLDKNIYRILEYIMKTPRFKGYTYSNNPDLEAHAKIARNAATESMVLLKNDHAALPLKNVKTIALYGKTSYRFIAGGKGSGIVFYKHAVSLKEGLETASYKLVKPLENYYTRFIDSVLTSTEEKERKHVLDFMPEIAISEEQIRTQAKKSDIAVITIGWSSGEGKDRKEADYFVLTTQELDLIRKVSELYHAENKKVVVILNIGGVIETASWKQYPDAILLAWQTGQEGGAAISALLEGKTNPSGKLPVTFPVKYADVPSAKSFPGEPADKPLQSFYDEGIYVGYRYYDSFHIAPSYEFGYGLSYTNFEYSNLTFSNEKFNNQLEVSVSVKNIGKIAGKEVVQLYLNAPSGKIEKPVHELKAFAKTRLLKPSESETLKFTIDIRALASFWTSENAWIADAGKYEVQIAASSRDIRLKDSFYLDKDVLAEQLNDVLQPNQWIKELRK